MITICFTFFKSLSLMNLAAALYSVRRQDLSCVRSIIVLDNDTPESEYDIQAVVNLLRFPVPVRVLSVKHDDPMRTHSWSTNEAVRHAFTPWVLFCRADYLLEFDALSRFVMLVNEHPKEWDGFITGNVYHLNADIGVCEQTGWREGGPSALRAFPGAEADYTCIDAGVWMARTDSFRRAGGLDESLTAWGHAQTHFQWKMHKVGVECVRIPEVLFYHPQHAAQRDIGVAHRQISEHGLDIREMWARYQGEQPYP